MLNQCAVFEGVKQNPELMEAGRALEGPAATAAESSTGKAATGKTATAPAGGAGA